MQLIPIRKKFVYSRLKRKDSPEGRTYTIDGLEVAPMPSVTNVLGATKDKSHLDAWAARVGQAEADRIKNEAATVGTHMPTVVADV